MPMSDVSCIKMVSMRGEKRRSACEAETGAAL